MSRPPFPSPNVPQTAADRRIVGPMMVVARALGWEAARSRRGAPAQTGVALGMTSNSIALVLAKVFTMGLGFAFWLVAARWFAADQVGLAAGAVSAMMLCTQIALLGAGSAFITLFPRHAEQPARLTDTSYMLVTGVSFVAGGLFLVLAQGAFAELGRLAGKPAFAALFLAMVVFGTLGILLDQAFTVLRRGDQALWRNVLAGALMLAGVATFAAAPGMTSATAIFSTWVLAGAAACTLGTRQLGRALGGWRLRPRIDRAMSRRIVAVGVPNHLLTLADRAAALILPIVVVEQLSPAEGAHWYTAWMMAWIVFIVPIQVGMTLFAETAHRSKPLNELVRHGLRTSLVLGVAAAAAVCLMAPVVLSLLGADYADAGTKPLRILVWAVIPMSFVQAYYAACRGTGRLRQATLIATGSGAAAVVAATLVAPAHGLTGIAVTWLAVQTTTGVLCFMLLRAIAHREPAASHAVTARAAASAAASPPVD